MLSAEWPKTSFNGKRRKRKKRKKKRRRKKKEKKGGKQTENKKQGGVTSDFVYCKSLDFYLNFLVPLGQYFVFPLSV